MAIYRDSEYDRVVETEENTDTGDVNIHELDSEGNRRWQIGHVTDDEFESRVDAGRYVPE